MAATNRPATTTAITLIVPGSGAVLGQSADAASLNGQALALLAGRGSVRHAWNRQDLPAADWRAWQRGVLDLLQLDRKDYSSASASALGDNACAGTQNGDALYREGRWLHAELVHFAAGLDRLTFLPLVGPAVVTGAEREALLPRVAQHLQTSSLRMYVGTTGGWFVHAARSLDVVTVSPDAAAANELQAVMPRGSDAGELRRMMTEWQMLLHEHPVNEQRQRRGLPAINAIWPWGGGAVQSVARRALPVAYANNAFLRGLYRMHDAEMHTAPADGEALLKHVVESRQILAVIEVQDLAGLELIWIAPLMRALRARRIGRLDLVLDEWHIQIGRGMLRRFWRKPLPPSGWPV